MPFETGSNTTYTRDYSGNNNNATGFGFPSWLQTSGYDGLGVYTFDGADDYLNFTHILTSSTPKVTYAAWVNPDDTNYRRIFSTISENVTDPGWYVYDNKILHYDTNCSSDTSTIPTGEWTHFAYTYNGSTSKIYINGQVNGTW